MKKIFFYTFFFFGLTLFISTYCFASPPMMIDDYHPVIDISPLDCNIPDIDALEHLSAQQVVEQFKNFAECGEIDLDELLPLEDPCEFYEEILFKSSHIISLEKGLDSALEEYIKIVPENYLIPVIVQLNCKASISQLIELVNSGFRFYRYGQIEGMTVNITFLSPKNIAEIINQEYIAGINLFKPSFKYHKIPDTDEPLSTMIESIEDFKPYHIDELRNIGLNVTEENYSDTLKAYSVKMSASQYPQVANLRWTKLISMIPRPELENISLIEATDKADSYVINEIEARIEDVDKEKDDFPEIANHNIYYLFAGIAFLVLIALVFVLKRLKTKP